MRSEQHREYSLSFAAPLEGLSARRLIIFGSSTVVMGRTWRRWVRLSPWRRLLTRRCAIDLLGRESGVGEEPRSVITSEPVPRRASPAYLTSRSRPRDGGAAVRNAAASAYQTRRSPDACPGDRAAWRPATANAAARTSCKTDTPTTPNRQFVGTTRTSCLTAVVFGSDPTDNGSATGVPRLERSRRQLPGTR
jgi:hypothetical protein